MVLRFTRPAAEPAVMSKHPAPAHAGFLGHRCRHLMVELLTAVDEDAEPALARIAGDVALELVIGVPATRPLTEHGNLDNYLLPVVSRLGQRRIPAVFARKVHADASSLTVAPAGYRANQSPPLVELPVVGSPERPSWKEQVREACAAALGGWAPYGGSACLDLAFTVSSLWNWTTLWKPTIDAVAGPLLGVPDPENPWSPNDGHITRLGLHRTIDDRLGYDVVVSAWWSAEP